MVKSLVGLGSLAIALAAAAPAFAQDSDSSNGITVSGSAAVVSDYRFRGISQTNKRFAVQGSLTVSHDSGLYASVWGSSIDDYVANGSDQEIDLIAGYKKTIGGTTIDGGVLYYYYPGSGGNNSDFVEPYLSISHAIGPVTGKLGVAYAPKQKAIAIVHNRDDNLYAYGEASTAIPGTPLTLSGHAGYTRGRSVLSAGLKDYWDWNLTAAYTWKNLTFSATYVDTDIKDSEFMVNGRAEAKAGAFGTVSVSF